MFKQCVLIIALSSFSLSLFGMEEGEIVERSNPHKRKRSQTTKKVKKRKLSKEQCYELWSKVKKSTSTTKLSNESLFYLMHFMPNEVQQLVADEFMREHIEPYYIGNILELDLKSRTNRHAQTPSITFDNQKQKCTIICNMSGGCQIAKTLNPQRMRLGKEKLTRSMFHPWNFAKNSKKCSENLQYVIEDENSNLIFGYKKGRTVFTLKTGPLLIDMRNFLVGKLTLLQVCQLYRSQIAPPTPDEKFAVDNLKKTIRTLCKDKQEETKKNE